MMEALLLFLYIDFMASPRSVTFIFGSDVALASSRKTRLLGGVDEDAYMVTALRYQRRASSCLDDESRLVGSTLSNLAKSVANRRHIIDTGSLQQDKKPRASP
jgi:hypothetical protein